ncbi:MULTISPECIES: hypothetical protein [Microcoleaceae]|nr:hypothetical protein [Lyngbya sp. CCAP 1446/10]MCW6050253.1 hypothetical protein [Lyngbya sp. CCAP 1446/10]
MTAPQKSLADRAVARSAKLFWDKHDVEAITASVIAASRKINISKGFSN